MNTRLSLNVIVSPIAAAIAYSAPWLSIPAALAPINAFND